MSGGHTVTGYSVFRYLALTPFTRVMITCTVTITGASASCTDTTPVAGTSYKYATAPTFAQWRGPESAKSTAVALSSAPYAKTLTFANGDGFAGQNDTVQVQYSTQLDALTVCTKFKNNTGTQTLTGAEIIVTITDAGTNDVLTVGGTGNCAFGSIALGGNYVQSTATFGGPNSSDRGTLTLSTTGLLTITLGALTGGTLQAAPVPSTASPVLTPVAGPQDLATHTALNLTPVTGSNQRF